MFRADDVPVRRLLHVFSTFDIGGPQIRFVQLVGCLGGGFEHMVIAMNGQNRAQERLPPGAPVTLMRLDYDKADALSNLWLFRRRLAQIRPHLLVTYNWGAIEWGLVNAVRPVCAHVDIEDGFGPEEAERQLPRRVLLRRLLYRRARCVVVPSRTLETVAREVWRLPVGKVLYIPNGVRTDRFEALPDRDLLASHGLDPDERLVGTVAALRREKNLTRLIEAFRIAVVEGGRRGRLVIVGDGPERAALEAFARNARMTDRVTFTGHVDRPSRLLRAFSMYALSSDTEQMPISLVEAMAAALPVAATDVGDVKATVDETNRRYVRGRDARSLADSLAALLDDPQAAARIGAANGATARARFSEETMVEAYRRVFSGEFDRRRHSSCDPGGQPRPPAGQYSQPPRSA